MAKQKRVKADFFNARELAEIPRLLMDDEQMIMAVSGLYTAGTAVLCVTNKRLLLIDKKLLRFSVEDVRFEAIKEVSYGQQAFFASLKFFYAGRDMEFRSWHRADLRMLAQTVQEKMFEVRESPFAAAQDESSQTATQTASLGEYVLRQRGRKQITKTPFGLKYLSIRAGRLALGNM